MVRGAHVGTLSPVDLFLDKHGVDSDALWVVGDLGGLSQGGLVGHIVKIVKDDYDTMPWVESVFPGGVGDWCSLSDLRPFTKSQEG